MDTKFNKISEFAPNELLPSMETKNPEDYVYIMSRFNSSNLPFNFKLNTRGGWISPDGTWYLPSITSNKDEVLRSRLKDSSKFNNNLRLQAFQEGWIRIDWKQPIFNTKFSINSEDIKKLVVTLDANTKLSYKTFQSIQSVVMLYTLILPKGLLYDLRLIKTYMPNKTMLIHKKTFRDFEFFNLALINQRK